MCSSDLILLRESYRDGERVKNRTLANLSKLPPSVIETLRASLKGETVGTKIDAAFEVACSLPHGHVAAVLGTMRKLKIPQLLDSKKSRVRDLCEALIACRLIETKPRSKLSSARKLRDETAASTLGSVLGLGPVDEDDLYEAMDWLFERQQRVEDALAKQHLVDGTLVLYDVTSTYFEGRKCPLAKHGYSRDRKRGKLQIVIGLLTDKLGCPVAIEVFDGNTGDPKTVASQVEKIRKRFGLTRVVLVGDRGMFTSARIREDIAPHEEMQWITALRGPAIRKLADNGAIQLSLFDEVRIAEIDAQEMFPNERLIVCRNPELARERARKRKELIQATCDALETIREATRRAKRPLRGKAKIALRVGRTLNRFKVSKHFDITVSDDGFDFTKNEQNIAHETALDGIYVIRTNVDATQATSDDVVRSYKSLSHVERAFRRMKTTDIEIRPINHRLEKRVRAHVFACMLAYYVEWHMRRDLAPLLFGDEERVSAESNRASVVDKAPRSNSATAKDRTKRTRDALAVQSFRDLMSNLATLSKSRIHPTIAGAPDFDKITIPTPLQQRAFDLLRVSPSRV